MSTCSNWTKNFKSQYLTFFTTSYFLIFVNFRSWDRNQFRLVQSWLQKLLLFIEILNFQFFCIGIRIDFSGVLLQFWDTNNDFNRISNNVISKNSTTKYPSLKNKLPYDLYDLYDMDHQYVLINQQTKYSNV